MKTNIVLVGFMGTGKSAVGKRLAERLGKEFVDTDEMVEEVSGMTVEKIFGKYGEVRFRSEERLAVRRAAAKENSIIATGGGAVLDDENMKDLKRDGVVICLNARPEIIQDRISRRDNRPLLKKDKSLDHIWQLLEEREDFYNKADYAVDTSDLELEAIVDRIMNYLRELQYQGG